MSYQRPDYAMEKLGITDPSWHLAEIRAIGDAGDVYVKVGGTVPLKRGPRKGQPKYIGPYKECVITRDEWAAAQLAYEVKTGKCHQCTDGQQPWGWSSTEGTKYKPCDRCGATGKAKATPHA